MDCDNETDKINFPLKAKFGNYRIASSMLKTEYTYESAPKIIRERSDEINEKDEAKII